MKFQLLSNLFRFVLALLFLLTGNVVMAGIDYHHDGDDDSRSYFFGNHIDTHQKSEVKEDGTLKGSLYIYFTGEIDVVSGLPIARHPRGASHNEVCGVDLIDCVVGWKLKGYPGSTKFLYHGGVNGDDHPVWMTNRVDIPNPGSFTHFHWITRSSTDDRASYVTDDCDKKNAGELEKKEPTAVNDYCDGWYIELTAIREFAFQHGGEIMPIEEGKDNATHLNLVTNYKAVEGITNTR